MGALTNLLMRLLLLSPWVVMPPWWLPGAAYAFRRASAGPHGCRLEADLIYRITARGPLRLDLYRPAEAGADLPGVLMIHGGGWITGSKSLYRGLGRLLATHGFLAAAIDYRLLGDAAWPSPLEDCEAALEWFRREGPRWGLAPDRVALLGDSAGAHLAAMLGLKAASTEPVRGVLAYYGPFLLTEPAPCGWPRRCQEKLIGGPLTDPAAMERAKALSPTYLVTGAAPPFFLIHGEIDSVVPCKSSEVMARALSAAGVPAELLIVKGAEHGLFSLGRLAAGLVEIDRMAVAFLSAVTAPKGSGRPGSEKTKE